MTDEFKAKIISSKIKMTSVDFEFDLLSLSIQLDLL